MTDASTPFRSHVEAGLQTLAASPDAETVVHGDRRITAGQLCELVFQMARALQEAGVRAGQMITLLSENLPEVIVVRYAAVLIGAPVTHLYNGLSAKAQAAIVNDIDTHVLVVDPRLAGRAEEITGQSSVAQVLALGPAPVGRNVLQLAAAQSSQPFAGLARPEGLFTIRHTGGATGHPKGVCVTYEQAARRVRLLSDGGPVPPRQLVCTTLAHIAGVAADSTLNAGGCVVLHQDFDPHRVLTAIEQERITTLFVLPALLYQLVDALEAGEHDISSLRSLVYGGYQASPRRIAHAAHRFGRVLTQVYGQCEAGFISVLSPQDHVGDRPDRLRTAGKVLPGVEVAVRDGAGRAMGVGEVGEVWVRSQTVMPGYWKRPDLSAEVLQEGWLHTGDLGSLDADGYLTVVDRLKDMIIVVGGHVYPTEIEDLLDAHPDVLRSAVFGVRDGDRTERVHAAVVLRSHSTVDAEHLKAMIRRERGPMYVPAGITFTEDLPLTVTGKPDKQRLRDRAVCEG